MLSNMPLKNQAQKGYQCLGVAMPWSNRSWSPGHCALWQPQKQRLLNKLSVFQKCLSTQAPRKAAGSTPQAGALWQGTGRCVQHTAHPGLVWGWKTRSTQQLLLWSFPAVSGARRLLQLTARATLTATVQKAVPAFKAALGTAAFPSNSRQIVLMASRVVPETNICSGFAEM